jgi:phage-related protein
LLRQLQDGAKVGLPHSRPMPTIGARCHELRVVDEGATWRIIYRLDADAVVIVDVFSKKTRQYDELTDKQSNLEQTWTSGNAQNSGPLAGL